MLSTLNPACPLCGLRFENKPLLDLHIREDHRQRVFRERNDDSDPGSTLAPASGAESVPDPAAPAATPSWTSKKAARPASRGRADRAKTALWRALRALHKSSANYGAPQVRLWASSPTAVPPGHGAPPQLCRACPGHEGGAMKVCDMRPPGSVGSRAFFDIAAARPSTFAR